MICKLEYSSIANWEFHDWTKEIQIGGKVALRLSDFQIQGENDEVQVICEASSQCHVTVTRVGSYGVTDNLACYLEIGESAVIPDGNVFHLTGISDGVLVSFSHESVQKEEEVIEHGTNYEIFFNGCCYDPDSHSLKREQNRYEMGNEDDDTDHDVEELSLD